MRKVFLGLAVALLVLSVVVAGEKKGQVPTSPKEKPKNPVEEIGAELRDLTSKLELIALNNTKGSLKFKITLNESVKEQVDHLKNLAGMLPAKDAKQKKRIEQALDASETFSHFSMNKRYTGEMAPLLLAHLRGQLPLAKPTELQKRLLKASNGKFDALSNEVAKEIDRDTVALEKELAQVEAKISSLEKAMKKKQKEEDKTPKKE
jgi:hypothetical protein